MNIWRQQLIDYQLNGIDRKLTFRGKCLDKMTIKELIRAFEYLYIENLRLKIKNSDLQEEAI